MIVVEMRCPHAPRMFAKMLLRNKPVIVEGNLIEFACRECRAENPGATRVVHRFNIVGQLIETEVITT